MIQIIFKELYIQLSEYVDLITTTFKSKESKYSISKRIVLAQWLSFGKLKNVELNLFNLIKFPKLLGFEN